MLTYVSDDLPRERRDDDLDADKILPDGELYVVE